MLINFTLFWLLGDVTLWAWLRKYYCEKLPKNLSGRNLRNCHLYACFASNVYVAKCYYRFPHIVPDVPEKNKRPFLIIEKSQWAGFIMSLKLPKRLSSKKKSMFPFCIMLQNYSFSFKKKNFFTLMGLYCLWNIQNNMFKFPSAINITIICSQNEL